MDKGKYWKKYINQKVYGIFHFSGLLIDWLLCSRHVIPTVDRRDEGPYFCEADNQLGQTGKGELNLIVLHEPKVNKVFKGILYLNFFICYLR